MRAIWSRSRIAAPAARPIHAGRSADLVRALPARPGERSPAARRHERAAAAQDLRGARVSGDAPGMSRREARAAGRRVARDARHAIGAGRLHPGAPAGPRRRRQGRPLHRDRAPSRVPLHCGPASLRGARRGCGATDREPCPARPRSRARRIRAIRTALAVPTASAAVPCVLTPEQTEGPYYIASEPFRSDVTEDRVGLPLLLHLRVLDATTCKRIEGATVEIWHCDAGGNYSGFSAESDRTLLRGQQTTNGAGRATCETIYPGWYMGRTIHIHVKVHVGGAVVHTGQLYFNDAITDAVYVKAPYAARGARNTTNATDGIYASGGARSTLRLSKRRQGYRGKMILGVHP